MNHAHIIFLHIGCVHLLGCEAFIFLASV